MPEIKETREQRHTGKRLAHINQLLDEHLKTASLPLDPPILHIVAAFGLDIGLKECGSAAQHAKTWASLDAPERVEDLDRFHPYSKKASLTREEMLWKHVTPLLRERIKFRVNRDLLPPWKQKEMERIAALTGFDYAFQWELICTDTLPVPKSWGEGIDPMTLAATSLAAAWRKAKPPGPANLPVRPCRNHDGVKEYAYSVSLQYGTYSPGAVQKIWFTDDDAALRGLEKQARNRGYKGVKISLGQPGEVTLIKTSGR